jgi:hypothetical protein
MTRAEPPASARAHVPGPSRTLRGPALTRNRPATHLVLGYRTSPYGPAVLHHGSDLAARLGPPCTWCTSTLRLPPHRPRLWRPGTAGTRRPSRPSNTTWSRSGRSARFVDLARRLRGPGRAVAPGRRQQRGVDVHRGQPGRRFRERRQRVDDYPTYRGPAPDGGSLLTVAAGLMVVLGAAVRPAT